MTENRRIMQRILSWIGNRFSREQTAPAAQMNPAASPLRQALRPPAKRQMQVEDSSLVEASKKNSDNLVKLKPEMSGRIENAGPGKNVLVQNKYHTETTGTHDKLKIIDDTLLSGEDTGGIDPYNTGKFDRSANWSRLRK